MDLVCAEITDASYKIVVFIITLYAEEMAAFMKKKAEKESSGERV